MKETSIEKDARAGVWVLLPTTSLSISWLFAEMVEFSRGLWQWSDDFMGAMDRPLTHPPNQTDRCADDREKGCRWCVRRAHTHRDRLFASSRISLRKGEVGVTIERNPDFALSRAVCTQGTSSIVDFLISLFPLAWSIDERQHEKHLCAQKKNTRRNNPRDPLFLSEFAFFFGGNHNHSLSRPCMKKQDKGIHHGMA